MIEPTTVTDDEFIYTCHTMLRYGGGFVTSIAEAGFKADAHNRRRLMAAFPEIFEQYGPGSSFYMAYVAER
jgi:hypothetical protein